MNVELGISTFGETTPLEKTGKAISHDERIRNLIEEVELADQVGIDAYAIGEHHRKDFAVSAPEIIIAMAAAKTKQIHLSSATTNLPTIDPIRVFEQYATIDAMAPGRIEIMAGRGSFTEAFDLFGYDLDNYDELFKENIEFWSRLDKVVLEKSYFERGTKLLLHGYRMGQDFKCKTYSNSIYGKHTLKLIEEVYPDGTLKIKSERVNLDELE